MSVAERIKREKKKGGILAVPKLILRAIGEKIAIRNEVLIISKEYTPDMAWSRESRIDIRPISADNVEALRQFCKGNKCNLQDMKRFDSYMRNNFKGWIGYLDNTMIGYLWWVNSHGPQQEHHPHLAIYGLPLNDDEIYTFDFFVTDEYRGDGNAMEFFTRAQMMTRDLGYNRAFSVVLNDNIPAKWTYASNGWKNGHIVNLLRIFKFFMVADNPKVGHKQYYIRNMSWNSRHSIDYQLLYPKS